MRLPLPWLKRIVRRFLKKPRQAKLQMSMYLRPLLFPNPHNSPNAEKLLAERKVRRQLRVTGVLKFGVVTKVYGKLRAMMQIMARADERQWWGLGNAQIAS